MKVGQNELERIESGFTFVRYVGKVEGEHALAIMDEVEANAGEKAFMLIEADMTGLVGAAPEARRITADRLRRFSQVAVAIVSSSFAQRMIAKLVLTAVGMLGSESDLETGYFSNSEDARVFFLKYAERKQAESSSD